MTDPKSIQQILTGEKKKDQQKKPSNIQKRINAVKNVASNFSDDDILRLLEENNYDETIVINNILDGLVQPSNSSWKQVHKETKEEREAKKEKAAKSQGSQGKKGQREGGARGGRGGEGSRGRGGAENGRGGRGASRGGSATRGNDSNRGRGDFGRGRGGRGGSKNGKETGSPAPTAPTTPAAGSAPTTAPAPTPAPAAPSPVSNGVAVPSDKIESSPNKPTLTFTQVVASGLPKPAPAPAPTPVAPAQPAPTQAPAATQAAPSQPITQAPASATPAPKASQPSAQEPAQKPSSNVENEAAAESTQDQKSAKSQNFQKQPGYNANANTNQKQQQWKPKSSKETIAPPSQPQQPQESAAAFQQTPSRGPVVIGGFNIAEIDDKSLNFTFGDFDEEKPKESVQQVQQLVQSPTQNQAQAAVTVAQQLTHPQPAAPAQPTSQPAAQPAVQPTAQQAAAQAQVQAQAVANTVQQVAQQVAQPVPQAVDPKVSQAKAHHPIGGVGILGQEAHDATHVQQPLHPFHEDISMYYMPPPSVMPFPLGPYPPTYDADAPYFDSYQSYHRQAASGDASKYPAVGGRNTTPAVTPGSYNRTDSKTFNGQEATAQQGTQTQGPASAQTQPQHYMHGRYPPYGYYPFQPFQPASSPSYPHSFPATIPPPLFKSFPNYGAGINTSYPTTGATGYEENQKFDPTYPYYIQQQQHHQQHHPHQQQHQQTQQHPHQHQQQPAAKAQSYSAGVVANGAGSSDIKTQQDYSKFQRDPQTSSSLYGGPMYNQRSYTHQ